MAGSILGVDVALVYSVLVATSSTGSRGFGGSGTGAGAGSAGLPAGAGDAFLDVAAEAAGDAFFDPAPDGAGEAFFDVAGDAFFEADSFFFYKISTDKKSIRRAVFSFV